MYDWNLITNDLDTKMIFNSHLKVCPTKQWISIEIKPWEKLVQLTHDIINEILKWNEKEKLQIWLESIIINCFDMFI